MGTKVRKNFRIKKQTAGKVQRSISLSNHVKKPLNLFFGESIFLQKSFKNLVKAFNDPQGRFFTLFSVAKTGFGKFLPLVYLSADVIFPNIFGNFYQLVFHFSSILSFSVMPAHNGRAFIHYLFLLFLFAF